ncbi:MAG: ImmA/IrrE family metallo-endopeptidase [Pirellulaceae bacterium]
MQGLNTATIRINATASPFRQRFTLAHELAHWVLGTKPDIATEPFRSVRQEECDADQLASEFLIPIEQANAHFRGHLPIDAKTLKRLAKAAKVSPVMAACRVVNAVEELAHLEWLGYVQPFGLVVSISAMLEAQCYVNKNVMAEHAKFLSCLRRTGRTTSDCLR